MANYINAFEALSEGTARRKHREMVEYGKETASQVGDKRLFDAIDRFGNELHANFYHGFMSEDGFKSSYKEGKYAIETLDSLLKGEIERRNPTSVSPDS